MKETQVGNDVVFFRKPGKNIVTLISKLVITDFISAIEELVVNSYDEDAHLVRLEYDPSKDTLEIHDDGLGMTPSEGLPEFYQLGDSPKKQHPISPGGRTRIGKHGVATITIPYLCSEYELVTQKKGLETKVSEVFDEELSTQKRIEGKSVQVRAGVHGTSICMKGLKFDSEKGFNLEELRRRFQWDLPLLPDFAVSVNGEELKPKAIENATKFRVSSDGKYGGKIEGEFYLMKRPNSYSGVYIYVNGRRIGDPKALIATSFTRSRSLVERVVGIIRADNLEPAILFDRGRFNEDHKGVHQLKQMIISALSKIKDYHDEVSEHHRAGNIESQKDDLIRKVKRRFVEAKMPYIKEDTEIKFSEDSEILEEVPGVYDSMRNRIVLNARNPRLLVANRATAVKYEEEIMEAVIDSLALMGKSSGRRSLNDFLKRRAELIKQLKHSTRVSSDNKKERISPIRVYNPYELARIGSLSQSMIQGLLQVGFLGGKEDVLGRDFQELEPKVQGLVALEDVLAEHYDNNRAVFEEKAHKIFGMARKTRAPFVYDFSKDKKTPFYVLEGTSATGIFRLLNSPKMDFRTRDADPGRAFSEFGNAFYTLPQLVEQSDSISLKDVARAVDYARDTGMKIENRRVGKGYSFKYRDFISVLQKMRGNNEIINRCA